MIIDSRYNGPPTSGNGGYSAGLVAALAPWPGAVEVTLRQPPPLNTELTVAVEADLVRVTGPDGLVAEGRPAEQPADTVPPVSRDEAAEAATRYPGFATHRSRRASSAGQRAPTTTGWASTQVGCPTGVPPRPSPFRTTSRRS
jgi:hypothetical protein